MTLRIRNATSADGALVLRFVLELAEYERLAQEVRAGAADFERALGAAGGPCALIAEESGTPVGFALYFFSFSTFTGKRGVYLEDLFVREEARGKGVGKALLSALARIAAENDCARLEWAVLDWNGPAVAFYKSLGAVPMDDWTVYRLSGPALEALATPS